MNIIPLNLEISASSRLVSKVVSCQKKVTKSNRSFYLHIRRFVTLRLMKAKSVGVSLIRNGAFLTVPTRFEQVYS